MTVKQINFLVGLIATMALVWMACLVISPLATLGYSFLALVILVVSALLAFGVYKLRHLLLYVFNDEFRAAEDAKSKSKRKPGW